MTISSSCLLHHLYCVGAIVLESGFTNGNRNQRIWLDNVNCQGSETRLIDCHAHPLGSHNCGHYEDAGVSCLEGTFFGLRIMTQC